MTLLLDTCTFLWVAAEPDRVSRPTADAFLNPDNERYLSAASIWEIAIKYSLGRMPLPEPPETYIPRIRRESGVLVLPVEEESALHVAKLPRLHADPFDRLLVAQAILHGMTVATPDEAIRQYPIRTLW